MENDELDTIAMGIFLASIASGKSSLSYLADEPIRAWVQAGYAFIVAKEFIQASKNVGANRG